MIDIHSHILPNIDDGASSTEESLAMAKMAVKDGIHTIIATPHINNTITSEMIKTKVSELNGKLIKANIPLQIKAGAEIPFHIKQIDFTGYTLSNSSYLLLELPHGHIPEIAAKKIYELYQQGYHTIIAHPERNGDILRNPLLLDELLDCGALAQITAGSITGEFGPQIQHCAHHLLRQKKIYFIASDSHGKSQRKPLLKKAVRMAGKIIGKQQASILVEDNVHSILENSLQ